MIRKFVLGFFAMAAFGAASAALAADLKAGDRVVVTATGGGKDPFVAKEVRVGAATAAAKTAPAAKPQSKK